MGAISRVAAPLHRSDLQADRATGYGERNGESGPSTPLLSPLRGDGPNVNRDTINNDTDRSSPRILIRKGFGSAAEIVFVLAQLTAMA